MPKTIKTSFTEIDAFRQCRLKHHLTYIERWRPAVEAEPLSRGTLFHAAMAAHYRAIQAGLSLEEAGAAVAGVLGQELDRERAELVGWIYAGYVERHGSDPAWRVVDVERRFAGWLPSANGGRSNVRLRGVIDLVVEWQGDLWIVDHKTCRDLPRMRDLDFDDQMGLYTLLMRMQGTPIRGAIYNACRNRQLKKPQAVEDRFSRTLTVRTEAELTTISNEVRVLMQESGRTRRGETPPRSPDPDRCGWRCPFVEPCLVGRKGGDIGGYLGSVGFVRG